MSLIDRDTGILDMDSNIDFIRQRMSEFKDTSDTSNLQLLYRSVFFAGKIRGLIYSEGMEMLSIGFQSGKIESIKFEIQGMGILDEDENEESIKQPKVTGGDRTIASRIFC